MTELATTIQQQSSAAATLQQQIQQLEARVSAPGSASRAPTMLVDSKNLGRLEKFKGGKKDWQDWSFAFRANLGGIDQQTVECLHWAAIQTETIIDKVIDLERNVEMAHRMNGQICAALSFSIRGDAFGQVATGDRGIRT